MEELLRGKEASEINLLELSRRIAYFPIRHHSPVCAWHLKKAIEEYQPDCILVEGPENANDLISVLTHEDTRAPLAIYYSYRDKKGYVSEEKEDYKCYYPLLDCSPELVALREAKKREIPAFFMDLPYGEILIGTAAGAGLRREEEKNSYNDDYLLSRSSYLELLCEKTGLRSFDEFWEKYFEIGGLSKSTGDFVQQMYVYCSLSREHTPKEELETDGTLLREQYMKQCIREAGKKYEKVLVVTGGFHTPGLLGAEEKEKEEKTVLHALEETDQGVYPMAYSMEAADALNGYASGMQSPGFYHRVWLELLKEESVEKVYPEALLQTMLQVGKQLRKEDEVLSSYDEICAFSMAQGLAELRGKQVPGLYELKDSVLSSFVKGEYSLSTGRPMEILRQVAAGQEVGKLCENAKLPPLLQDFEEICRRLRLKIHSSMEQEVVLELFSKQKHLEMSRFFYRLDFLEAGFAKKIKGADLLLRKDRNLIREIWKYKWSSRVVSALIDQSVSGGTVEEACQSLLQKRFSKETRTKEAAGLCVQAFLMGLMDKQGQLRQGLEEILAEDGDFFSLTGGLKHLMTMYELQRLYQAGDDWDLTAMMRACFEKILVLLPSLTRISDDQVKETMEACMTLYQMARKKEFLSMQPRLKDTFSHMMEKTEIHPGLEGAVWGLLYGYDGSSQQQIERILGGYVHGTKDKLSKTAAFLRGLFFTARDLVFVSSDFLRMIDLLIERISGEEFMKMLPELRMAFSYFTPVETDRIAGKAADFYGMKTGAILKGRGVTPEEYAYGEALDAWVVEKMKEADDVENGTAE